MRFGRRLKGIDRQIQQNLNHIGAMHAHAQIAIDRLYFKFILLQTGMNANKLRKVSQKLVDANARNFVRLLAQKPKVALRNLNAVRYLASDRAQPPFNELKILD